METIRNLLLIAGTGTKTGKTTMACRIISELSDLGITAIKITPHFHETTPGLITIDEGKGYAIYEETESGMGKDTSRMLAAGADKVYFAKVWDEHLPDVFRKIMRLIAIGSPVICESPALRKYIEPGVFLIMKSMTENKQKNISDLLEFPHVMVELENISGQKDLPVRFDKGSWKAAEK